eukprot:TRINITY_DN1455_c0_g1_i3.p1 TRINITY_DN1455_c0_g1~~TRINITY_DN1455_c0_g1_i3.p1  ORF type:complete len:238 (-),score=88.75 TRINITY_DN1455_c0_g1_i3:794-1507(-)
MLEVLSLSRNPDVVLVDTELIVQAPARFLVCGVGDALATWFEAESCRIKHAPNCASTDPGSLTAYALARLCYDTIKANARDAVIANGAHVIVPAFEHVVEANTLLSGLGFESAGLAAAHSIHNGLTQLPQTHEYYHGEKVAFGTLASLFITDKPQEMVDEVYSFCELIGLPTTFADIGLEGVTDEELKIVADKALAPEDNFGHEPFPLNTRVVIDAMKMANAVGVYRKQVKAAAVAE